MSRQREEFLQFMSSFVQLAVTWAYTEWASKPTKQPGLIGPRARREEEIMGRVVEKQNGGTGYKILQFRFLIFLAGPPPPDGLLLLR